MPKRPTYRLLLLAGLLTAACGKVQTDPSGPDLWNPLTGDVPVRFASSVKAPETKTTAAYFGNGDQIGVFGYYHDNSTWDGETDADINIPDYMYDQCMTYDGSSAWAYSPIKYWPNETDVDLLSFWAYFPHGSDKLDFRNAGVATPFSNTSTGIPDVSLSGFDGSIDFMTSDLAKDYVYGTAAGTNPNVAVDGKVPLQFHHRLSAVSFKARSTTPESSITITQLDLLYAYDTGVYSTPSGWDGIGNEKESLSILSSNLTLNAIDQAVGTTRYILPQALSHSGANAVAVRISYTCDGVTYASDLPLATTSINVWEENKQYTYTFAITGGTILFSATMEAWEPVYGVYYI